jgi:3-oxoacyl-(acyl-carrier-protein) synthase
MASRVVWAGLADKALVLSFDFLSPFVAGGFHALKILNADFPSPYRERDSGAIGLGDGAGFAVVSRGGGDWVLSGQSVHNEMHHFTSNRADGSGFSQCLEPVVAAARGRRVWFKGHGTGTLEAGRLEVAAAARAFPGAPLVGWKGSLGHTLGSCGLVELAIAVESARAGRTPGTIGGAGRAMGESVALGSFDNGAFDGVVCASNAFGGAHAAFLLCHA